MFVEMKSILSGNVRSKEIDVSLEQVRAWLTGDLIQDAMPNISPEERDFFKGIFWDECGLDEDEVRIPPNKIFVDMFNPVAAYLRDRDNEN